jgi:endogenous inhibitor of DNA gyrase (YacG/DUF329 family)
MACGSQSPYQPYVRALCKCRTRCLDCGKPAAEKYKPFCGKRCADVDLNRWLSNVYAVPANAADADEDEKPSTNRPDEEP